MISGCHCENNTQLDYAIGPKLYLIPSNMVLDVGSVMRYNNNIQVATGTMSFGINKDINHLRQETLKPPKIPVKVVETAKKETVVALPGNNHDEM